MSAPRLCGRTYYRRGRPFYGKRPPPNPGPVGGGRDTEGVRPQDRGADVIRKTAAPWDKTSAPQIVMYTPLTLQVGRAGLGGQEPGKAKGKPAGMEAVTDLFL